MASFAAICGSTSFFFAKVEPLAVLGILMSELAVGPLPARKRRRRMRRLPDAQRKAEREERIDERIAKKMIFFDQMKAKGCCGKKCLESVDRQLVADQIRTLSELIPRERRIVLCTFVACSPTTQKYCMRQLGNKNICRTASQAILGVKRSQWENMKNFRNGWKLGSFSDRVLGRTCRAWTFQGYGGVEVLNIIVHAVARDFATYSPGRYFPVEDARRFYY